ncbi:B3 domain-containing protein REM9-like [Euphorbia lathyris]|uniref:B3 domain-containing protein REM9-like n=1 Tax=Euphorbia lathyris TaxID=212925 RepID=UPI003313332B
MQPSHVGGKYRLDIPSSFSKKYIKKRRGNVILNSIDEKTWSVEYADKKLNGIKVLTVVSRGWRKFVEDNHLDVGDVCVFELINHNATEFQVVICREKQDVKRNQPIGNKQPLNHKEVPNFKAINDIRDLNKFTTSNPYFKATLLPSYLEHHHINVPVSFVAKCKKQSIEKLLLKVGNKVWPVKFKSYPLKPKFRLSGGFTAFVKDNSLQVGDVCVFKLINGDTLLLNVTIFRKL